MNFMKKLVLSILYTSGAASVGEILAVSGDTFTSRQGAWIHTWSKEGKKISTRAAKTAQNPTSKSLYSVSSTASGWRRRRPTTNTSPTAPCSASAGKSRDRKGGTRTGKSSPARAARWSIRPSTDALTAPLTPSPRT